jgi:hypothetical protein
MYNQAIVFIIKLILKIRFLDKLNLKVFIIFSHCNSIFKNIYLINSHLKS